MSVIEYDFGKGKRQATRRFRELLSLDALHEANVRANPLPYLERASERIYQLEKMLFEAVQAAKPPLGEPATSGDTIEVDKAEYQRLLACLALIEDGLAKLKPDEDDVVPR
jgi:hypothetical protein